MNHYFPVAAAIFLLGLLTSASFANSVPALGNFTHPTLPSSCLHNTTNVTNRQGDVVIGKVEGEVLVANVFRALNQNKSVSNFYIQTGGLYLLPEPVPIDGRVVQASVFGYISDENLDLVFGPNPEDAAPFLYVLAFRHDRESDSYQMLQSPMIVVHRLEPSVVPIEINVTKGDRIGVFIPHECELIINSGMLCPSQINLRVNSTSCMSALYYPAESENTNDIPVDLFEEVQVNLNMEVVITPAIATTESGPEQYIVPIVPIVVTCVLAVVLGVGILVGGCAFKYRKRKLLAEKFSDLSGHKQEANTSDVKGNQLIASKSNTLKDPFADHTYETPMDGQIQDMMNGYALVGKEEKGIKSDDPAYMDVGNDYDYQEPYFEPASKEEELIMQLNTTLAVTTIPREQLELGKILGSGEFGTVHRGVWSNCNAGSDNVTKVEVAIKTIRKEVDEAEKVKFLQEATIMAQFKHSNIVRIRGVVWEQNIMIVFDLLGGGDLRQYLQNSVRNRLDSLDPLELGSMLLSYTRQVALGVAYLKCKSYVHRDLAARNILLSQDGKKCKIGDFGLSRDLQNENFYISQGGKIPVKWTAPEALLYRKYSPASDVWSYGCVCYEIWSLGEKPFHDKTNPEAMKFIAAGYRLPPPPGCPECIYSMMIKCWNPNIEERHESYDIVQELQESDYHILKWSAEDMERYGKQTRSIGESLHFGKELFKELQNTYLINTMSVSP